MVHCVMLCWQINDDDDDDDDESYMISNDLQFGFKRNLGCSHAVFVLRQCVEYSTVRGRTVFMASLDAKKLLLE